MKIKAVIDNKDILTDSMLIAFFEKHSDEVYGLSEISDILACNKYKLKHQLYKLSSENQIGRYVIHSSKYLYGSLKAIKALEKEL